ncbi:MAG: DUF3341 domain-containing protein, partial [Fimbriimonadaceae bacterium]|nr:DUF3341 domain-containing protein [Fimbriimonadaceae bacterium]
VGGKPNFLPDAMPAYVPVTFELTILLAGLTAAGAMLALNGLPKPHHPVFNAEAMTRASQDGFILCIEADDPNYDPARVVDFLESLNPKSVEVIQTSEGY